ncbi:ABC-F family ATP-binding cassette domain-containing protein [Tessaracoccus sp. MC1627]|uniref:ATP-binding cassette domain-containing protein n=1 Tax=Tessaracoccus sp. MC1627 TaxID=2760312 RepID=UPI001601CFB0|nr:ATP-binding cassette domain-containing protein [Tessaracoccus sp. MC1627]MBB1513595.1 ABC-F family ATP-binding cassette domain-containing protein [Tessaracoccus sp. MC1627]
MFSVTFNRVRLTWPDGTPCLDDVTLAFSPGVTGVVGDNGSGKSTLLKLITGEIAPTAGTVVVGGSVGVLPQNLTLRTDDTVADLLGIRAQVDAVRAIVGGDPDPAHFDAVGEDWDIEARAAEELGAVGLDLGLDRPVGTLSGGEAMLVALVGLSVRRLDVVLLDEPTNNLDRNTRVRVYSLLERWRGTAVVVSHDVELLRRVGSIVEVRDGEVEAFGGNWEVYREAVGISQEAAGRALRAAEQQLRTEKRQKVEAEKRLARRENAGKPAAARGVSKAARDFYANRSEKAIGKARGEFDDKIAAARSAVDDAEARLRDDERVRIDLPDPGVGTGRRLAEIVDAAGVIHVIQGPERVALVGPNGVGKTLLIELMVASADTLGHDPSRRATPLRGWAPSGSERRATPLRGWAPSGSGAAGSITARVGYLPQRLDHLDDARAVLDCIRDAAPTVEPGAIRNRLARFGLRGDAALRPLGTLSGGERFRASLAALLLAEPPAQLLILDEPSNNLDLATVEVLVDALRQYRGGLLVVSHDDDFLARLAVGRRLELHHDGSISDVVEPVDRADGGKSGVYHQ